jgi:hypothetical protein
MSLSQAQPTQGFIHPPKTSAHLQTAPEEGKFKATHIIDFQYFINHSHILKRPQTATAAQ